MCPIPAFIVWVQEEGESLTCGKSCRHRRLLNWLEANSAAPAATALNFTFYKCGRCLVAAVHITLSRHGVWHLDCRHINLYFSEWYSGLWRGFLSRGWEPWTSVRFHHLSFLCILAFWFPPPHPLGLSRESCPWLGTGSIPLIFSWAWQAGWRNWDIHATGSGPVYPSSMHIAMAPPPHVL